MYKNIFIPCNTPVHPFVTTGANLWVSPMFTLASTTSHVNVAREPIPQKNISDFFRDHDLGKTGVKADRDKIEFRLFGSGSILWYAGHI